MRAGWWPPLAPPAPWPRGQAGWNRANVRSDQHIQSTSAQIRLRDRAAQILGVIPDLQRRFDPALDRGGVIGHRARRSGDAWTGEVFPILAAGGNADATQRSEHIARITAGEATDEQGAVAVPNAQAGIAIGVRWAKAFIGAFGEPLRFTTNLDDFEGGCVHVAAS
jgi:hypothetical protein